MKVSETILVEGAGTLAAAAMIIARRSLRGRSAVAALGCTLLRVAAEKLDYEARVAMSPGEYAGFARALERRVAELRGVAISSALVRQAGAQIAEQALAGDASSG